MTDSTTDAAQSPPTMYEQLRTWIAGLECFNGVQTAVELDLAEHLANGPLSVAELASRTNAHAPSLFRLLRALEGIGIFKQVSPRVFASTPDGELLRRSVPRSLWAFVRGTSACGFHQALLGLSDAIRTGRTAFEQVHGCSVWEYQQRDPRRAAIFDEFFRSHQSGMAPAVTSAYDWSRFPVIADIGGGIGAQLVDILNAHRSCRGIIFDRPEVVERAISHDRVERAGGSFFERVPEGADAYILRSVIHDWADAESIAILKTIRAAAKPESRVILIEQIIPETPEDHHSKWLDLSMMVLTGGRERTATEYRQLLEKADLELEQIVPTTAGPSLVVGRPRD